MKKVIIIVSLCVVGQFVVHAQEDCDTLKWKVIKTYYGSGSEGRCGNRIGCLDGAVINVDTFSNLYHEIEVVNISNDTFDAYSSIYFFLTLFLHADTGVLGGNTNLVRYDFDKDCLPDDTLKIITIVYPLPYLIQLAKSTFGVELEEISYWEIMTCVVYTSKDGYYSHEPIFESTDTATFRVVRGGVGIKELQGYEVTKLQVYPNPANNQLQVTSYELQENSEIQIFNVMGQCVGAYPCGCLAETGAGRSPARTIDISHLAKGMYFLKVGNKVVKFVKQ